MFIKGDFVSKQGLVSLRVLLLLHFLALQALNLNFHRGHLSLQIINQTFLGVFKVLATLGLGCSLLRLLVLLGKGRVAFMLLVSELATHHVVVKGALLHRSSGYLYIGCYFK